VTQSKVYAHVLSRNNNMLESLLPGYKKSNLFIWSIIGKEKKPFIKLTPGELSTAASSSKLTTEKLN
jgi:hypothetical protein